MDVRGKLVELLYTAHNKVAGVALEDDEKTYSDAVGMEADELIANGVTVQEWVSVDDRLPNLFENVIVFRDGKISIDYNEENGWFAYDLNGKRVTCWMPLPEKPKGE